jgi:hypothetical protein
METESTLADHTLHVTVTSQSCPDMRCRVFLVPRDINLEELQAFRQ